MQKFTLFEKRKATEYTAGVEIKNFFVCSLLNKKCVYCKGIFTKKR